MTIMEALAEVDELKPNTVSRETKIRWLGDVDGMVVDQLIRTHEQPQGTEITFTPYSKETDENTVLMIPHPHSQIYRWYLEAQIHLRNMEMEQYQNMQGFFEKAWMDYKRKYNREHMPLQRAGAFRF